MNAGVSHSTDGEREMRENDMGILLDSRGLKSLFYFCAVCVDTTAIVRW